LGEYFLLPIRYLDKAAHIVLGSLAVANTESISDLTKLKRRAVLLSRCHHLEMLRRVLQEFHVTLATLLINFRSAVAKVILFDIGEDLLSLLVAAAIPWRFEA